MKRIKLFVLSLAVVLGSDVSRAAVAEKPSHRGENPATAFALPQGLSFRLPDSLSRGVSHRGSVRLLSDSKVLLEELFLFRVSPDATNPALQFASSRPRLAEDLDELMRQGEAVSVEFSIDGSAPSVATGAELLRSSRSITGERPDFQPVGLVARLQDSGIGGKAHPSQLPQAPQPRALRACSPAEQASCDMEYDDCRSQCPRIDNQDWDCESPCFNTWYECRNGRWWGDEWTDVYYYNARPTYEIACLRPFWYNPFAAHNYMRWDYLRVEVRHRLMYWPCNGTYDVVDLGTTYGWAECWRETYDDSGCDWSNSSCCANDRCPF